MLYHVERGRFKLLEKRTAELVMIAIEPEQVNYAKVRSTNRMLCGSPILFR